MFHPGNKGSYGPSFRESEKEPMNWRRVAIIGCVLLVPVFGVVAAIVLAVYFCRPSRKGVLHVLSATGYSSVYNCNHYKV